MKDILYVGISIGFFAVMLVYVQVCRALGRQADQKDSAT
jgi:hypothetical protein